MHNLSFFKKKKKLEPPLSTTNVGKNQQNFAEYIYIHTRVKLLTGKVKIFQLQRLTFVG